MKTVNEQQVLSRLRQMNESEVFYRNYRLAKSSPGSFQAFLDQLDPAVVRSKRLLIPEWPETIQPEYLEELFFIRIQYRYLQLPDAGKICRQNLQVHRIIGR